MILISGGKSALWCEQKRQMRGGKSDKLGGGKSDKGKWTTVIIPWDSHARSQETPPAYRPHWRGQSPQNPVEDVLSSPGDRKLSPFFSHPYVIVPVENLRGQNIPLTVLFLPTIAHVGSVILIQNCKMFTILQFKVNVERWTWLPGFMMSITSNSFFLIVRTIKIFCCSFSSWGVFRLMSRQRTFFILFMHPMY